MLNRLCKVGDDAISSGIRILLLSSVTRKILTGFGAITSAVKHLASSYETYLVLGETLIPGKKEGEAFHPGIGYASYLLASCILKRTSPCLGLLGVEASLEQGAFPGEIKNKLSHNPSHFVSPYVILVGIRA